MRKVILALALSFISFSAMAGQAVATWTTPTTYTDMSALPASQIASYNVYYGTTSGGPYTNVVNISGANNTTTIANLAVGTWYFVATVVSTNGLESAYSNQASKVILSSAKPSAVTITVQ
jgi:hypothetical protein